MYSCGTWHINVEFKTRVFVCFNKLIRRIFVYYDFESVKDILFGFDILPIDMYKVKARLLLVSAVLRLNSLA